MVWSVSVDMGNEECRSEVFNAFKGAADRKAVMDRFDMYQWPDMANVFTLTTKNNDSAAFADYKRIEGIAARYPSLLGV